MDVCMYVTADNRNSLQLNSVQILMMMMKAMISAHEMS